ACVARFFNFEAASGYTEGRTLVSAKARPTAVKDWLARGRKWNTVMPLGVVGHKREPGTFVAQWWSWWREIQPSEREWLRPGVLSTPETADWSQLAKLRRRNGLLQVMATLLWWGDHVATDPNYMNEWTGAVTDVLWVLEELLKVGPDE
ncbi:hypothetical protein DFH07DRAFT_736737, partial [Mycena maculata]